MACATGMRGWAEPGKRVEIRIDSERRLGAIPVDFMGLGYEISSVSTPGLLSASNRNYVALVRRLGARGVIRIGGNTSDYSAYSAKAKAAAAPKATLVNANALQDLGGFLDATGWSLIWGLNLGNGNVEDAVTEARAVARAVGERLLAFEVGNEPDLYVHEGHRRSYSYDTYLREYRRYKIAVRDALPHAAFTGPDAAVQTEWVERFAEDEGRDLRLLTHHYYREGQNPRSTAEKLLNPDPKLSAMLERMQTASWKAGVPYRICETNSFSGGGRPGVSDTFAAALWVLDYLCVLAWHDASGVNVETGVNQLDFVSSYSPIADDQQGHYTAPPEYYGMLAFAEGCRGDRVAAHYDAEELNLTAYASSAADGMCSIVIINKDTVDAEAQITLNLGLHDPRVLRLTAPSLASRSNVTLGETAVEPDGSWHGRYQPLHTAGGACVLQIPSASAAIVRMKR